MIDESQQSIVVTVASFDSALFASFVEHLEREYGIRAYADDNEAWAPKQPDWQLVVSIRDVPYKAKVAQLINLTGHLLQELGVALFPVRAQMDEIALLVPLHFLHHSQASSQVKSSQVKSSQVRLGPLSSYWQKRVCSLSLRTSLARKWQPFRYGLPSFLN